MRSPQTIGDDWPMPLRETLHRTDPASHRMGRGVPGTWPSPEGPRQPDQFGFAGASPADATEKETVAARITLAISSRRRSIIVVVLCRGFDTRRASFFGPLPR